MLLLQHHIVPRPPPPPVPSNPAHPNPNSISARIHDDLDPPLLFFLIPLEFYHLCLFDSKEKERALLKLILCNPPQLLRIMTSRDLSHDEDFSKVTEVRFSLVDGTGGIDLIIKDGFCIKLFTQVYRSLALFAAGCSLNAEELAISKLGLPRPPRISEMSVEELDANEKQAFLNWRRMFVRLEENEKLVLTPFEKNLDIWRQLWRVLERSDLIVMVVDARDVLVPALQKRDIIARAKTGTAKTVTGNTTLDVKAERAEDVLTHQRYMLRPRRKWELKRRLYTPVVFKCLEGTPPRISEMSVEELDANEKQAFLNWRRMFVRLEENEKLVLTPFEKNLDIWRQLWQVLERRDLIFLVDDARGVLVHALQKRDIIARAKTGTAKTVTGNTTLDVKAERTCRRCSHTSEIHAKAKKEMGAQDMFVCGNDVSTFWFYQ
ncbi:hypothetical protein DY000_02022049 [Brassica cretica]|uniref:Uncharacterized protein n=1 Tax=Brassica cretica TaxID=69181 RepID=A0ABQ7EKJ0_BRACR|nr:hypothetical protein DY000_02022049 [Brassica cretica]